MGISYEYWGELQKEMLPYIDKVRTNQINFDEFKKIYNQKYKEFVQKYDK